MDLSSIIWMLPVVFMLHDFEEILMMNAWMNKNKNLLINRFPKLGKSLVSSYGNLSTASFSMAVAEEFLILVIASFLAAEYHQNILWLACFIAFSVHLIVHIVQWLIVRRYIPAIISSFLALIYSIYSFIQIINYEMFSITEYILIGLAGIVLMALNLYFIHKMAAKFEQFIVKYEKN
jgi:hypothetical protein